MRPAPKPLVMGSGYVRVEASPLRTERLIDRRLPMKPQGPRKVGEILAEIRPKSDFGVEGYIIAKP